jgi:O-antigen ligase
VVRVIYASSCLPTHRTVVFGALAFAGVFVVLAFALPPTWSMGVAALAAMAFALASLEKTATTALAIVFCGMYPISLTYGDFPFLPGTAGMAAYGLVSLAAIVALARERRSPFRFERSEALLLTLATLVVIASFATGWSATNTAYFRQSFARLAGTLIPACLIIANTGTAQTFERFCRVNLAIASGFTLGLLCRAMLAMGGAPGVTTASLAVDNTIGLSNVLFTHFAAAVTYVLFARERLGTGTRLALLLLASADLAFIAYFTQRSALLGILGAVVLTPFLFRLEVPRQKRLRWRAAMGAFALATAALLWIATAKGLLDSTLNKLNLSFQFARMLRVGDVNLSAESISGTSLPLGSISVRIDGYLTAWRAFTESPWTGIGFSRFEALAARFWHGYPHNIFLDFAVSFGIAGLLVACVFAGLVIYGLLRARALSIAEGRTRPEVAFASLMVVFFSVVLQVSGGIQSIFPLFVVSLFLLLRATSIPNAHPETAPKDTP